MALLDSASFGLKRPPFGGVLSQHEVARLAPHLVVELVAALRAQPLRPVLARLLPLRPGLFAVGLVDLVGRRGELWMGSALNFDELPALPTAAAVRPSASSANAW